ncbi:processed acidic surface protein [Anaerobacillus sp. CMMVII]|uniref:processed acidic surface protein n=1 Tax=Anaerobacillus sp. CMMVII TaxID=2755588 RepID=UPI0021B72D8A|nr:processed acidic surface protein [Anaerobacillus sp. CMMVII]MCT8137667.1 processed acidic surface protein [Anaerobacillus sp. CMMVII]
MKRLLSLFLVFTLVFSALPISGFAAMNESDLEGYLTELNWTKEELEEYLDFYLLTLEDFESVEELRMFFGPILTDENLQQLLEEFNLTLEELEELLAEYGESLADYYFYNDLEYAIYFYLEYEGDFEYEDIMFDIFNEIGLTEEELDRLFSHLLSLDIENPEFEAKLLIILERLEAFEAYVDLESATDLEAEQIAELAAIFTELLHLFELEAKFFFVKGDEKKPVSLVQLMKMQTSNGYDLLIEFYNLQGEFLADILLTAELFGVDLIVDTGSDLEKIVKKEKAKAKDPVKTEKGAKLPKTGTNNLQNSLLGLLAAFAGFIFFRKLRVRGNA